MILHVNKVKNPVRLKVQCDYGGCLMVVRLIHVVVNYVSTFKAYCMPTPVCGARLGRRQVEQGWLEQGWLEQGWLARLVPTACHHGAPRDKLISMNNLQLWKQAIVHPHNQLQQTTTEFAVACNFSNPLS